MYLDFRKLRKVPSGNQAQPPLMNRSSKVKKFRLEIDIGQRACGDCILRIIKAIIANVLRTGAHARSLCGGGGYVFQIPGRRESVGDLISGGWQARLG